MDNNPFFEKPPVKRNWFIIILQSIVALTSIGVIVYLFILLPNEVDGPSMEPNFYTDQLYFGNRLVQWLDGTVVGEVTGFKYQRGDVIVMQIPGLQPFIKRIVAVAGDRIKILEGDVYINGQQIREAYLPPATYTTGGDFLEDGGEEKVVPAGSFFAMGDNRAVSYDSRSIGFIKKEWIRGKVFLRFWPLSDFGLIPTGDISTAENSLLEE